MNDYEAKLEARRQRLLNRAAGRLSEAAGQRQRGASMSSCIPMGQPILVGHHSEKRHRRDIDRIQRAYKRAFEAGQEAQELKRRAAAVGTAGVSSDDPEAVTKLREKLVRLEEQRETKKRINKEFRKGGWAAVTGLTDEEKASCARTMVLCNERVPYPSYSITGLGANIRATKERIEQLTQAAAAPDRAPLSGPGWMISEDRDANRVRIEFQLRQPDEVCKRLKSHGFHWNRGVQAWTRQLNSTAWYTAQLAVGRTHDEIRGSVQYAPVGSFGLATKLDLFGKEKAVGPAEVCQDSLAGFPTHEAAAAHAAEHHADDPHVVVVEKDPAPKPGDEVDPDMQEAIDGTPDLGGLPFVEVCKQVVEKKAFRLYKGVLVDLFSASAVVQVVEALSPENRVKFEEIVQKRGPAAGVSIVMKLVA